MKLISWWHHEEATYESGSLFCLDMVFVWVVLRLSFALHKNGRARGFRRGQIRLKRITDYSSGFITTNAELPLLMIFEARALICSAFIPSTFS